MQVEQLRGYSRYKRDSKVGLIFVVNETLLLTFFYTFLDMSIRTIDEFSIMSLVQMLIGIFAFSGSPAVEGQSSTQQRRREDIPNRNPAHFLRLRIARRRGPNNRRREEC